MDNKMDNLEEVDKFLDKYNLPTWSQEEIENVNRPITSNEIESVIKQNKTKKTFKQTKVQDQGFTGKFYQTFREELTPIFLKLFPKMQRKEHSPTHSTRPPSP